METLETTIGDPLSEHVPPELQQVEDLDTAIPQLSKDPRAISAVEASIRRIPTTHDLYLVDARIPPTIPEAIASRIDQPQGAWVEARFTQQLD
jgi:hypothetical protein